MIRKSGNRFSEAPIRLAAGRFGPEAGLKDRRHGPISHPDLDNPTADLRGAGYL